ncbi:hypothetical protein QYF36_007638 [Acer negundo]|nr:hypothetical protein QYF36_007638 [Acer negundo]
MNLQSEPVLDMKQKLFLASLILKLKANSFKELSFGSSVYLASLLIYGKRCPVVAVEVVEKPVPLSQEYSSSGFPLEANINNDQRIPAVVESSVSSNDDVHDHNRV